ncbi:unnamed protein product [Prunus armeniaca]|uniref:Uncharacterized protein n=1 Tax=Prunus armeniaca TaxID=36596 RepID=A0A6J5VHL8_PRUAR|nr:unnamed protein product [Prunus armeniaca]
MTHGKFCDVERILSVVLSMLDKSCWVAPTARTTAAHPEHYNRPGSSIDTEWVQRLRVSSRSNLQSAATKQGHQPLRSARPSTTNQPDKPPPHKTTAPTSEETKEQNGSNSSSSVPKVTSTQLLPNNAISASKQQEPLQHCSSASSRRRSFTTEQLEKFPPYRTATPSSEATASSSSGSVSGALASSSSGSVPEAPASSSSSSSAGNECVLLNVGVRLFGNIVLISPLDGDLMCDQVFVVRMGSHIFCRSIRSDGWPYYPDTIEGSFTQTCPYNIGITYNEVQRCFLTVGLVFPEDLFVFLINKCRLKEEPLTFGPLCVLKHLLPRLSEAWHSKRHNLVEAVQFLLDEQDLGARKVLSEVLCYLAPLFPKNINLFWQDEDASIDPSEVFNRIVSSVCILLTKNELVATLHGCTSAICDKIKQSVEGAIQAVIEFVTRRGNELSLSEAEVSRLPNNEILI